jgi:hypothetical protein
MREYQCQPVCPPNSNNIKLSKLKSSLGAALQLTCDLGRFDEERTFFSAWVRARDRNKCDWVSVTQYESMN